MRGQRSPFFGVHIIHCAFACNVIQLIAFQSGAGHAVDLLQLQGKPQAGKVIVVGSCGQRDRHRALVAQICRGGGFAHLDAQQPVFSGQQVNHLRVAAQVQKGELIVLQAHRLQLRHHCQVQRGERVVVAVQIFQVRELLQPLQGCNPTVAYVHTDHLLPLRGRKTAAGIRIQTAHVR